MHGISPRGTHKDPKFGRVRQVPILEPSWEFLGWDLSHFAKFGIFGGYSLNTLKYPKMGIHYFFLWGLSFQQIIIASTRNSGTQVLY